MKTSFFACLLSAALTVVAAEPDGFRKVSSVPRDGYTLETWEFYPDDPLAAKKVPGVGVSGEIVPNCRIPAPHLGVDGVKKATGCRMMSEHDYVPERPDGRTEKTCTWIKMVIDGKVEMPK